MDRELKITPRKFGGNIHVPPSKSHSLRALMFAMLGNGTSKIDNLLPSPDCEALLKALSLFGASYNRNGNSIEITGNFSPAQNVIDAGNSGIIFRFVAALAALLPTFTIITGDHSIRTNRPILPLLDALKQLGAFAERAEGPIVIKGPIKAGKCSLVGNDSQLVSALLIATSFLEGSTEIFVTDPGETPWIDLTLSWIEKLGGKISHENYSHYKVGGGLNYKGFNYTVPGDFSSAAFPLAAALTTGGELTLTGLDPHDSQGDKILIEILQKMGADLRWEKGDLFLKSTRQIQGCAIDLNTCIDALPILAVLGCFAEGTTTLYNGSIARAKESDRIAAICEELQKMGALIEEKEDGLIVKKSTLKGASLHSHSDHRIGMSLAIAALNATGASTLTGTRCISKTYPNFISEVICG